MSRITKGQGTPRQQKEIRIAATRSTGRDSVPGAPVPASGVARPLIEKRAYDIYLSRCRNGGAGDQESDWLQAERELKGSAPDTLAPSSIEIKRGATGR